MNIGGFLRRNAAGLVLLGSFSGCSGLVIYPAFQHAAMNARRSSCQANLKLIAMACLQYQAEYEGHYPPLSEAGRGWSEILKTRNPTLDFSCRAGYKSSFSPSSDYFFNAQLAKRRQSSVRDSLYTVAFGDGPDNGASNSHYCELPTDGADENSPLQRHYGLGNYAFADGHIKSLNAKRLGEWVEDYEGHNESHYKWAPDESASRAIAKKQKTLRTPDAQTKRLQELVDAARSFRTKK